MKLKQFKEMIDAFVAYGDGEDTVCVVLSEPTLGPSSTSLVKTVMCGFDWDTGKFMIYCEDKLVKKEE